MVQFRNNKETWLALFVALLLVVSIFFVMNNADKQTKAALNKSINKCKEFCSPAKYRYNKGGLFTNSECQCNTGVITDGKN